MSWNNRVVWSEGMFLRPQHFQQHDRYLETLVDGRCRSLLAGGWGFSELKLDDALLTQGKLAIVSARGVLPDGTPFNIPADDPAPAPLNVEESLRDGIVYLGLPLKRVGTRDTVEEGEALGGARYVSQVQEVRDDNAAFESRAPVALGSQAFRLLTERDGLGEYAAVGVARVREKRADQALSLDEDYLPPVLDIAAAPPLASFAKELLGLLHQRGEALAGRVVASSAGGASEIADFLLLQLVNRAEALTGHLSRVRPLHPQELYRELVALAGEFCTFTASQRRPEEYPVYNHDDLAASFAPVMLALRQALATVIDAKAIAIPIVEKAYGVRRDAQRPQPDRQRQLRPGGARRRPRREPARALPAAGQGRLGGAHPRPGQPATAGYRPAADAGGAAADPLPRRLHLFRTGPRQRALEAADALRRLRLPHRRPVPGLNLAFWAIRG